MDDYLFLAKTNEAHCIKTMVELLHHVVKIGCFIITDTSINLRMIDSNKKILIDCSLFGRNFSLFYFDNTIENRQLNCGVNLNHMFKMIRSIKKRDTIELYIRKESPNELNLRLVPKDLSRVTISKLMIQNVHSLDVELPNLYSNNILVNSIEFSKACKDLLSISPSLLITAQKYFIKLHSDVHSIFSRTVILGTYNESMEKEPYLYSEEFDNEFLSKILKISGLHHSINLCFDENSPFNIRSKVGSLGEISLFLKSKKQLEQEKYMG